MAVSITTLNKHLINERLFPSWKDQYRQRLADFFACVPEKPLPPDELFALAMQDYWKNRIDALWINDKGINEEYPMLGGEINITDRECGLIRDKKGKPVYIRDDTCYPWKIKDYPTLDALRQRLKDPRRFQDSPKNKDMFLYDRIVQYALHGQVNRPNEEQLYNKEHYNSQVDFAVIHKFGDRILWYPQDCCRLSPYFEANTESISRGGLTLDLGIKEYLPKNVNIDDLYFLRITYKTIDSLLTRSSMGGVFELRLGKIDENTKFHNKYYVVSPCGMVLYP